MTLRRYGSMRHHPARTCLICEGVSGGVQVLPTAGCARAVGVWSNIPFRVFADAGKCQKTVLNVLRMLNVLIRCCRIRNRTSPDSGRPWVEPGSTAGRPRVDPESTRVDPWVDPGRPWIGHNLAIRSFGIYYFNCCICFLDFRYMII